MKTAAESPRVEEAAAVPRVRANLTPQEPRNKNREEVPNLIPADDSDDESSDDESDYDEYEPAPAYNTRAQMAKKKSLMRFCLKRKTTSKK